MPPKDTLPGGIRTARGGRSVRRPAFRRCNAEKA